MAAPDSAIRNASQSGSRATSKQPEGGMRSRRRRAAAGVAKRPPASASAAATAKNKKQSEDEDDRPAAGPDLMGRLQAWVSSPVSVSTIVHVVVLFGMALAMTSQGDLRQAAISIVSSSIEDEPFEELSTVEIETLEEPPEEMEIETPSLDSEIIDPGAIQLGEVAAVDVAIMDLSNPSSAALTAGDFGADFGSVGDGLAAAGAGAAGSTFFGRKSKGSRIAFVMDNSNSMIDGRMETSLIELRKAVNALGPQHAFYVIFYSDTAYPMFHPKPLYEFLPATPENKEKLGYWLETVEMCFSNNVDEAMQIVDPLNPDVIQLLTDGTFHQGAETLTNPGQRRAVVNTFGMQVNAKARQQLQGIAKANNGDFYDVDVLPEAEQMFRNRPIKLNTRRGPVWGRTLRE